MKKTMPTGRRLDNQADELKGRQANWNKQQESYHEEHKGTLQEQKQTN